MRPRPPSTSTSSRTPLTRSSALEGAADYVTVYSFETRRQGRACPSDPSRLDRITDKLQDHVLAAPRTPPHYAIIQVQPVIEQEAEPGEAPPTPEADPDPAGRVA